MPADELARELRELYNSLVEDGINNYWFVADALEVMADALEGGGYESVPEGLARDVLGTNGE